MPRAQRQGGPRRGPWPRQGGSACERHALPPGSRESSGPRSTAARHLSQNCYGSGTALVPREHDGRCRMHPEWPLPLLAQAGPSLYRGAQPNGSSSPRGTRSPSPTKVRPQPGRAAWHSHRRPGQRTGKGGRATTVDGNAPGTPNSLRGQAPSRGERGSPTRQAACPTGAGRPHPPLARPAHRPEPGPTRGRDQRLDSSPSCRAHPRPLRAKEVVPSASADAGTEKPKRGQLRSRRAVRCCSPERATGPS